MLVEIPSSTKELWAKLEEKTAKLEAHDRNMFVLDLIRFVTEWQFHYLAMKQEQKRD